MDQATWRQLQNFHDCYLYQSKYGDLVHRGVLDLPLSQTSEIQISRGGHIRRARTPYTCRIEVLRPRAGRDQCTAGNQPTDFSESTQPARTTRRVGQM